jgi:hypothetical protein
VLKLVANDGDALLPSSHMRRHVDTQVACVSDFCDAQQQAAGNRTNRACSARDLDNPVGLIDSLHQATEGHRSIDAFLNQPSEIRLRHSNARGRGWWIVPWTRAVAERSAHESQQSPQQCSAVHRARRG